MLNISKSERTCAARIVERNTLILAGIEWLPHEVAGWAREGWARGGGSGETGADPGSGVVDALAQGLQAVHVHHRRRHRDHDADHGAY